MRRKIRKFADKEQTDNQTDRQTENSSKTEATLILCGSLGERANNSLSKIYFHNEYFPYFFKPFGPILKITKKYIKLYFLVKAI